MTDFSFNIPPLTTTATENVDPQGDSPTPSKIRLRLTCPTPMAVFNSRVNRASGKEPEVSNNTVGGPPELTDEEKERPKAGESVDKRPKPQMIRR
ncbi:hypothetical protein N0V85_009984, partial [Neurospora sp. IMI 360204]